MENKMNNDSIDYNVRQIKLMEKKIIFFKNKEINIYELLSDLMALLSSLQNCDTDWFSQFQSQLGTLDTIYANTLYENRTTFTDLEESLVNKSLQKIISLINAYKKENFREEDF